MKFWDSSALVPLLAAEGRTRELQTMCMRDPEVVVWWGTVVECASAIARLERDGALSETDAAECWSRLDALAPSWMQIDPSDEIRESARRVLRVHPLRAADALQLAAALIAAERRPSTLAFITLDDRLRDAAAKEGFHTPGFATVPAAAG